MRLVWGKVLIVLTLALTLANAQCFARCLVQPCDAGTSPCHSQGNQKSGHCSYRHAITGLSAKHAVSIAADSVIVGEIQYIAGPDFALLSMQFDFAPSTVLRASSVLPLRI